MLKYVVRSFRTRPMRINDFYGNPNPVISELRIRKCTEELDSAPNFDCCPQYAEFHDKFLKLEGKLSELELENKQLRIQINNLENCMDNLI
tara:strand:- start:17 stop:289 length:273 start_codon:yes stop_codon:yes gene_type:complete